MLLCARNAWCEVVQEEASCTGLFVVVMRLYCEYLLLFGAK